MKNKKLEILLALTITAAALAFYTSQSWSFAQNQVSVLDEGAYLIKGLMFARGDYEPYQDYGFLTNHMPLSFLIPGYILDWFGPGLRTARIYAVILGVIFLAGFWALNRRIAGQWWAALAVWLIALNPALIKIYSQAVSQVLVASMLIWILVLVTGENRPPWAIISSALLAGLLALTRINMAPVLLLVALYIFWQHGIKMGWWAVGASGTVLIAGHLYFFPGILRMWAYWFPESVTPFLANWRAPAGTHLWDPVPNLHARLLSFFQGFRFHFLGMVFGIGAWLRWPRKNEWKTSSDFRTAVFLSGIFGVLLAAHMMASIGLSYCTFCFNAYQGFYSFIGIVLGGLVLKQFIYKVSIPKEIFSTLFIILISAGVGFSTRNDIGKEILLLKVPHFQNWQLKMSTVKLSDWWQIKFGHHLAQLKYLLPTLAGLSIGIGILLALLAIFLVWRLRKGSFPKIGMGSSALGVICVIGIILTPTAILGKGYQSYDGCGPIITSYETVGDHLSNNIPPGSKVYWQGGLSAVPLLYLENPNIYPAQINMDYSFRLSGNDDALSRYGLWSESLAKSWLMEVDYALISRRYYDDTNWLRTILDDSGTYEELPSPPLLPTCDRNDLIHIFKRIK